MPDTGGQVAGQQIQPALYRRSDHHAIQSHEAACSLFIPFWLHLTTQAIGRGRQVMPSRHGVSEPAYATAAAFGGQQKGHITRHQQTAVRLSLNA